MADNIMMSVVLPVRNEAGSIVALLREITDVCVSSLRIVTEIIVVDDASDDGSGALVEEVASHMRSAGTTSGNGVALPVVRLIRLPFRSGQSNALMAGFTGARGEYIVSMDADGQFDPADIPRLFAKMDVCDMVCGYRAKRYDGIARQAGSRIANHFRNFITCDATTDAGCTFRCMRTACVRLLQPVQGKLSGCEFFFHPLLVRRAGLRVEELPVSHRPRSAGTSKYRVIRGRMGRGMWACIRVSRMIR